jgi:hypothetical protein
VDRPQKLQPKNDPDGDGEHFHGTTRKNATHASTTDPHSRLYRRSEGTESTLCGMGHATMENRNGLAVAWLSTQANGTAERAAAEEMLGKNASPDTRITVGADKAYDMEAHVELLRTKNITPHIAVNAYIPKTGTARTTSIDGRTTWHTGYNISQRKHNMIECLFGWGKQSPISVNTPSY